MTDVLVVRAEVRRLGPGARSRLVRAGTLTPYLVQTITEDAAATGRPSRLQVTVSAGTSDRLLARVREAFAGLDGRGVRVKIRRRRGRAPENGRVSPRHTAA
ncbi:MAG: hypothetical protein E6J75_04220 [Deltaproteobacteria bacterium]|nr:MAG: hypothetical protein E6J79_16120 [Deltaproteobacteria bacterium]TMA58954.1 MAG: hypothetical protein E6J75_04220 [Deltaproteobacteria bacterium]